MDAVICGIDPGLGVTGYAVLRVTLGASRVLDAGVCRLGPGKPLGTRLVALEADLDAVFEEFSPEIVAVEELYSHYRHPRTAILMGHARGVVLCTAARRGINLRGYSATRIKRHLTGNGRASKPQVQRAVQNTLGLESAPEPHDVADALAVALCCAADVARRGRQGVAV